MQSSATDNTKTPTTSAEKESSEQPVRARVKATTDDAFSALVRTPSECPGSWSKFLTIYAIKRPGVPSHAIRGLEETHRRELERDTNSLIRPRKGFRRKCGAKIHEFTTHP